MNLNILIPLFIGCVGILQGAINRQVANYIGVAQATLITNMATVLICALFYFIVKNNQASFPTLFQIKSSFATYKWWFIFPPIFGFIIVAGMPFAISKLGAVKVTVGLIAAQMITSVIWDFIVDGIGINLLKVSGIFFALLSVIMITISKQ